MEGFELFYFDNETIVMRSFSLWALMESLLKINFEVFQYLKKIKKKLDVDCLLQHYHDWN